jgi:hypothetical protein
MDKLVYFVNNTSGRMLSKRHFFNKHDDNNLTQDSFIGRLVHAYPLKKKKKAAAVAHQNSDDSDSGEEEEPVQNSDEEELAEEESDIEAEPIPPPTNTKFGHILLNLWVYRSKKLVHEYSVSAWILCPHETVQAQVKLKLRHDQKKMVVACFKRVMAEPGLTESGMALKLDKFWSEWNSFASRVAMSSQRTTTCGNHQIFPTTKHMNGIRNTRTAKLSVWADSLALLLPRLSGLEMRSAIGD